MASHLRMHGLDGLHLPPRSMVDSTATSQMGVSHGSAARDTSGSMRQGMPQARPSSSTGRRSRTPARKPQEPKPEQPSRRTRSRTPARSSSRRTPPTQTTNFALSEISQPPSGPGPLRELWLRGGPNMGYLQATAFTQRHTEEIFPGLTGEGPAGAGLSMGPPRTFTRLQRGGDADDGTSTSVPGHWLWSHLGPSNHSAFETHGPPASHRRQPDVKDLALRKLNDDRANKGVLGRTPWLLPPGGPDCEIRRP